MKLSKITLFSGLLSFILSGISMNAYAQEDPTFGGNNFKQTKVPTDGPAKAPASGINYVKGPNGTSWYYSAKYEQEEIYYNEYYTDVIIGAFTFTFYDNMGRKVGTVHDKVHYAANEVRDRECFVYPLVTTNFFNTDDKPEIMVFHAINTQEYINHYYYSVYSIGGVKDENGYDKEIMRIEGRCIEALDHNYVANNNNYLITFVQDPYVNMPLDDPDYVAKLDAMSYKLTTYSNAENDVDGPKVYITKDIGATRIPGDTTEGMYYISKRYDGRLFFIYSQYEKPYFVDPRGSAEDETQTVGNSLVIDVYEVTGDKPEFISFTSIPLNEEQDDEALVYTFMGIGNVGYDKDVDMKFNGTPEAPAFLVTRSVAYAADIENMKSSYYIYDCNANLLKTIAEDTENFTLFNNGDLEGPLSMFVKTDSFGNYIFVFAYIYSGNVLATISQTNDGDPLYASCYPIKMNGEYKFVFEMKYFGLGSLGNLYARVAWFDSTGTLERIDRINLGKEVQAARVYLSNTTLNPKVFDNDDAMEYAVLVKRTYGGTTRNEYLVVDDNGGRYATYSSDDGKGQPVDMTVYGGSPARMTITYENGSTNVTLPFKTQSTDVPVGEIVEDYKGDDNGNNGGNDNSGIFNTAFDEDTEITYYNLQGQIVKNPAKGIYIRKAGSKVSKVIIQ